MYYRLKHLTYIILFIVTAAAAGSVSAQDTVRMVANTTTYVNCDTSSYGVIYDDGGPDGDYTPYSSSSLVMFVNPGDTLELQGRGVLFGEYDNVSVYHDGTYEEYYDGDSIFVLATNMVQITLSSYDHQTAGGLSLNYRVRPTSCNNGISGLSAVNVGTTDAYLVWTAARYPADFVVSYNGRDTVVRQPNITLSGLSRNTTYHCTVAGTTDSGSAQCLHECSFTTDSCINTISQLSAVATTPTSIPVSWDSHTAARYRVTCGSLRDTTSQKQHTFAGLSPNTAYPVTVVALYDTCCAECAATLTAATRCYQARVSGIRPLVGSDTVTLTADFADGYRWSTGDTTRSIRVSQPGFYTLTVHTRNGGCYDSLTVGVSNVELDIDIDIPPFLCPGESAGITVGTGAAANVHVHSNNNATLGDPSRIFLPDGRNCDPASQHGCSYRSELDFSGFGNHQLICDVNDIRYVMLDIEHSYVGDLYINITCPNGQNADILRYSGNGTSECTHHIGAAHRTWADGENCLGCSLGVPVYSGDAYSPCDSTRHENMAGDGWRYCWSNNSEYGFSYAPGDGLFYRTANTHTRTIDSSNVAAGTNFYRPDQSLEALVGCPMNGTWYIEVIDGWNGDNGYIFGWQLALNPDRLSLNDYRPSVAHAAIDGMYAARTSDTSFAITCPTDLSNDTTIGYTVHIYDTAGNRFDTSFAVTFRHPAARTVCDTVVQNQLPHTVYDTTFAGPADSVVFSFASPDGCDSTVTYSLHVIPNGFSAHDTAVCDNQLPFTWHGTTFTAAGTQHRTVTAPRGNDSTVTLTLRLLPTYTTERYDTICDNDLPGGYAWDDTAVYAAGSYARHRTTRQGCDSLLLLHLTAIPTAAHSVFDTIVENQAATWDYRGIPLHGDTSLAVTIARPGACDSVVTYHLHVWHNAADTVDTAVCADALGGFSWHGRSPGISTAPGSVPGVALPPLTDTLHATVPTTHGADSNITLILLAYPTYDIHLSDTICDNQARSIADTAFNTEGTHIVALRTVNGCDSLVTLHLTVNDTYRTDFYDTIYAGDTVSFHGSTYSEPGTYSVTYSSRHGCDSVLTIHIAGRNITMRSMHDSICQGDSVLFFGRFIGTSGTYYDTIRTDDFFLGDTVVEMNLTVVAPPQVSIDTTHRCSPSPHYLLHGTAGAPYLRWYAMPHDTALVRHEHDSVIQAAPGDSCRYFLLADYRETPLCPATDSVLLPPTGAFAPAIELSPSSITLDNRTATAHNRSSGRYSRHLWYVWYDGIQAYTSAAHTLQLDVPAAVDSIQVSLQLFQHGCSELTTAGLPIRRSGILFPNIFTPSADDNNTFAGTGKGVITYEIWIYDRRGDIVFHSADIRQGWDGTKEGRPCPQGTYVYYCRYTDQLAPNSVHAAKGTVTLIR